MDTIQGDITLFMIIAIDTLSLCAPKLHIVDPPPMDAVLVGLSTRSGWNLHGLAILVQARVQKESAWQHLKVLFAQKVACCSRKSDMWRCVLGRRNWHE
jgi:hypothetical protein